MAVDEILAYIQQWRNLPIGQRAREAVSLLDSVLNQYKDGGITPVVQSKAVAVEVMFKLMDNSDGIKLRNQQTVGEAMQHLIEGRDLPAWKGHNFISEVKKMRQHVVWQRYLSAWTQGKKMWCRLRGKEPFETVPISIAVISDFYRLRDLTDSDIADVAELMSRSPEHLQRTARAIVGYFTQIFHLKRSLEAECALTEQEEQAFDIQINNLEENIHGQIEDSATPYLEALRNRDLTFTTGDEFAKFIHYLVVQHLRGPGWETRVRQGLRRSGYSEAITGVLRHIFANNIAYSLFIQRKDLHIALLESPPDVEFITGDQPVLNTHARHGVVPEKTQLYYPLAPRLAFLLTAEPAAPGREIVALSSGEVATYNERIMAVAHQQIYASTESALHGVFDSDIAHGVPTSET